MTLTSVIIRDAYRESNLLAISADPTADEQEEGLRLLNRVVSAVYGTDAGEQLDPVVIGRNNIGRPSGWPWYDQIPDTPDWYVPQNSRLVLNLTAPQIVYLDPNPEDGSRFAVQDKSGNLSTNNLTVIANGRTIQNANQLVFSTNAVNSEYIYRQDTGNWAIVTPLIASDPFPFPPEFDDFFVISLSMRLNPRHATVMDDQSVAVYKSQMKKFRARYRQHQPMASELGLIKTLGNGSRYYDDTYLANALFNSGRVWPFGGGRW